MAFTMESDKHRVWRVIQDTVGNETIFGLFENQKGGYGIDYRQIDQLIQSSQASFRIYTRQREVMEDQILELV
jgi:parvulin-like peptidyl-prolyl isomerase